MEYNVRNPELFHLLRQFFGEVKVQNHGQQFRYKAVPDKGGRVTVVKVDSGEEYCVCCPHCGDTRFRLNINHVFGTRIEGTLMDYNAHCWNEDCQVLPELREIVSGTSVSLPSKPIEGPLSIDTIAESSNEGFKKLDNLLSLNTLRGNHPACTYLKSRGMNPRELGEIYGVSFCESVSPEASLAARRIIFPLYHRREDGVVMPVGWQAGFVPYYSPHNKPKYWTSPGCVRSAFLYMFLWAEPHDGLVVVEGAIDAHTIGPPACATLGRRITSKQRAVILDTFGNKSGPIVLIGDKGFEESWGKNYEELRSELGDRVILFIPEVDSNDLGREEIHRRIKLECASRSLPSPV